VKRVTSSPVPDRRPSPLTAEQIDRALTRARWPRPPLEEIIFEAMVAKVRDEGMAPTADLAYAYTYTGPHGEFDPEDREASEQAAGQWRDEMDAAARDAVAEAGYDLDDDEVFIAFYEDVGMAEGRLDQAEMVEMYRDLHAYGHMSDEDFAAYHHDPLYQRDWSAVYGPPRTPPAQRRPLRCNDSRHRRARGGRPVRRNGSRRVTGTSASRGDPPGGDSDDDEHDLNAATWPLPKGGGQ
jgi:hypothetical protein